MIANNWERPLFDRHQNTYLRVALGAQRAGLEHGELVEEAALVHVQPRVDVVQRGAHAW